MNGLFDTSVRAAWGFEPKPSELGSRGRQQVDDVFSNEGGPAGQDEVLTSRSEVELRIEVPAKVAPAARTKVDLPPGDEGPPMRSRQVGDEELYLGWPRR